MLKMFYSGNASGRPCDLQTQQLLRAFLHKFGNTERKLQLIFFIPSRGHIEMLNTQAPLYDFCKNSSTKNK